MITRCASCADFCSAPCHVNRVANGGHELLLVGVCPRTRDSAQRRRDALGGVLGMLPKGANLVDQLLEDRQRFGQLGIVPNPASRRRSTGVTDPITRACGATRDADAPRVS